ncbi:MAG: tetratricopeptide repeat protein, partial [Planctomycetes bacterium]|nr:tetratricopeptide repeat protein [Planctomycetota bacterium]
SRYITRGDRVPWWKGGMWRNRRSSGSSNPPHASSPPSPQSSGGRQASAADDIWGGVDDEYSGYNPDGTFGRQGGNGNFYTATANPPPYSDPYAQPQYFPPQYPGQSHSQLQDAGGFVGESYSLPESSYPNSAYSGGSVYPGGGIPFDPAYNPGAYNSEIHGGGYSQPQAFPPAPMPIASAPQPGSGFIPPPPGGGTAYQVAVPAATPVSTEAGTGSVQFQNAVQLVKENRFREAKAILTDETSRDPLNASAWRWLGDCHYNLLELDAAIEAYRRALARDPNDYYALRGSGFANLHRGHEHWRRMQDEVARGQREQGAATFSQAHENYKTSLELLGLCLRRAPNDGEAIYGEAMAAEGASRKLYSNAVSFLRLGPENRERAEIFAENCLTVINKGIERATMRSQQNPGDSGPRALLGGLYLRKAILFNHLGKNELALIELKRARDVQQSILDEIDKNNATAQRSIQECDAYWEAWGGGGRSS